MVIREKIRKVIVMSVVCVMLGSIVGCAENTLGEKKTPTQDEALEMFVEETSAKFIADSCVPVGNCYITFAFKAEEGIAKEIHEEILIQKVQDGSLSNMTKWSANYSGAAGIAIAGGAVEICFTGNYPFATVAYCDGLFLVLEGERISDLENVMVQ